MAAESASAAALTLKSGLGGAGLIFFFSAFAVVVGFKVVPLAKGHEKEDAARRLACGFLSSATVGLYTAYRFMKFDPDWLGFWMQIFQGLDDQRFFAVVAAGMPFVVGAALAGFWIVAGFMRLAKRQGLAIGDMGTTP